MGFVFKVETCMKNVNFLAGEYKQQFRYRSFTPSLTNRPFRWSDPQIDVLLEDATRLLGELNAYSYLIPNVDFFIRIARNQRSYDIEPN
jgi:hypothetical protein